MMNPTLLFSLIVLAGSCLVILSVFLLYPAYIKWRGRNRCCAGQMTPGRLPGVSLIVAARNAENIIENKVRNCLELNYPNDRIEVVVFSDGSSDRTMEKLAQCSHENVKVLEAESHLGKSRALNEAVAASSGEILVFTDADALLDPEAVNALVGHFTEPEVGGVCGRRVIAESGSKFGKGQGRYIDWDSRLKELESRCGRITSNDGKLYAIRRSLFKGVADGVTDDLYVCLAVIESGFNFIFEARAKAFIRVPSRNAKHEIQRRRRIVTRSLRGIYLKRRLLNPLKYGEFAVGLMINKVFRRVIPFAAVGIFLSSCLLLGQYRVFQYLVYSQLALLGAGPVATLLIIRKPDGFVAQKACSLGYFVLGTLGTFLGFIDFLAGRKINKWNPIKND